MEEWRKHYHDVNESKQIPPSDIKCYGCGEEFNYEESITFINADPYCGEHCFMSLQVVDTSWSTCDWPTPQEEARLLMKKFTPNQIKAVKAIAELFDLDLGEVK